MRIGLIGLGQIAKEHLQAIRHLDGLELIAVSDVDETKNPTISGVKFFGDYKKMLMDENIDAVTIASPNYLHVSMTIDALNSGKYVLVEKPMATSLEDAQRMIDAAKANGKVLVVSYHFQFVPEVQYFLQRKEDYGKIKSFETFFTCLIDPLRAWLYKKDESGGGVWTDNGINVISVLRLFIPNLTVTGARFEYGQREIIKDPHVEDWAEIHLKYEDIEGTATIDWRSREQAFKTKFQTERGAVVLDHYAHTITYNGEEVFRGKDQRYIRVYNDFIDRVNRGDSNASEAIQDLKLVVGAYSIGK